MKKLFKRISSWYRSIIDTIKPYNDEIKGASRGMWLITILLGIIISIIYLLQTNDVYIVVQLFAFIALAILSARLVALLIKKINSIPRNYKLTLFAVLPILAITFSFSLFIPIILILLASITGASIISLKSSLFKKLSVGQKIVRLSGLLIGFSGFVFIIYIYSIDGFKSEPITNAATKANNSIAINANNPSEFGDYNVEVLYYGSGKDKHRDEFGAQVDIKTDSVDGTAFIDNWSGFGGWYRTKYWGFDAKALPLNGRVWYPEGEGKFPLVLVVHGNHGMQDFSDPGYDYLGEVLASRGYILASVDENFINGTWTDIMGGLKKENDARAWLLLEHLKQWHKWNNDSTSVFYNKIDTNNIALIGHSRGGEAVAHAACFNKLSYYPDDADIKLGYNYNIKSVIAIAPCDGQYKPAKVKTPLKDIDYFVLHGAHDSDVQSFMGSQQYERVKFSDSLYHFKAGLYIYGANHGQFNTTWGINDTGNAFDRLLNLKQIMNAEEQRKIAKVYISAFLETTLKKKYTYLPLFMDHRTGKDWLPNSIYLNQFQDSKSKFLCTFDEDIDISSSTDNTASLKGTNLTVWKEKLVNLKWGNKGTKAVYLGWNNEKDSTKIASYTIDIKKKKIEVDSSSVFIFSMADADEDSNPKSHGKWISANTDLDNSSNPENGDKNNNQKEEKNAEEEDNNADTEKDKEKDKGKEPIDFTITMEDNNHNTIEFPLSNFSFLQPKLKVMLMKVDYINNSKQSENVFQLFRFPLKELMDKKPDFNYKDIKNINFIFNKTKKGVIIVDNIGFTKSLNTTKI